MECKTLHPLPPRAPRYVVDASLEPPSAGVPPDQAVFDGAMHFAQYLAAKQVAVDVWDGESLLQASRTHSRQ
jgi:hypothetical protein